MPISLAADERAVVLIRIRSETSIDWPVVIRSSQAFNYKLNKVIATEMLFYGLLLSLFLSQASQFLLTRQSALSWYSLTVIATIFFFATVTGTGTIYVWHQWGDFSRDSMVYSFVLLLFSLTHLGNVMLGLRNRSVKWYQTFRWLAWGSFIWVANLYVFGYKFSMIGSMLYGTVVTSIMLIVAAIDWIRGNREAKFFIYAWGLFIVTGIVFMSMKLGWISFSFSIRQLMQLSAIMQLCVFYYWLAQEQKSKIDNIILAKDSAIQDQIDNLSNGDGFTQQDSLSKGDGFLSNDDEQQSV
jgi:hypothetical protein